MSKKRIIVSPTTNFNLRNNYVHLEVDGENEGSINYDDSIKYAKKAIRNHLNQGYKLKIKSKINFKEKTIKMPKGLVKTLTQMAKIRTKF